MHTASLEIWEAQLWRNMSKSVQQSFGTIELWYRFSRGGFMPSLFDIGSCASESSSIDRERETERDRERARESARGRGFVLVFASFSPLQGVPEQQTRLLIKAGEMAGGGGAKAPEFL